METYDLHYNGAAYPAADITIFEGKPEEMNVTVSSTILEGVLMDEIEAMRGDEAYRMDEKICYYLTPEEFLLPYEEIVKIVEASYL